METLAPAIRTEYLRWQKQLDDPYRYLSDITMGIGDVLRAHFLIADYFYKEDSGLGGVGVKILMDYIQLYIDSLLVLGKFQKYLTIFTYVQHYSLVLRKIILSMMLIKEQHF